MAVVATVLALIPVDRVTAHIWADQQYREVNAGVPGLLWAPWMPPPTYCPVSPLLNLSLRTLRGVLGDLNSVDNEN